MARFRFGYFFLLLPLLDLEANPSDPTVISGHASCISTSQKLEVNAHDKTIISWKDFSIGSKETTHFNLPSSHSVILNRVSSHNISKIEGLLSSNGIVYLINPNGILITPSGKIDTAGFLASTLNITDQDFLNGGDILFTGSSGSITNLGAIRCSSGDVILMACQVKNDGTIEAPEGKIALGAAQEILMTLQGEERLTVRLSTPDSKEEIGVHQTGTLESLQAELKADGNLFAYAIKNEGHINATSAVQRNGRIYLVAEKGHVTSSGTLTAPGGEVRILGQIADVIDDAQINVSHHKGGGTVLIGGDYQGKNPDILNAERTFVGQDVVISAAALESGNGGKVIAWADGETFFYGKIEAQGGLLSGDGGFAEVSGANNLDFHGRVNLTASNGATGTLLLDPSNLTLSTSVDSFVMFTACPTGTYDTTANNANIQISELLTNLATCSISITTTGGAGGTGFITVLNPIDWTGTNTNTLTVTSGDTLTFNAAVTNETTAGTMIWNSGHATFINFPLTNGPASGSPSGAPNFYINCVGTIVQAVGGPILNNSASGAMTLSAPDVAMGIQLNGTLTNNSTGLTELNAGTGGIISRQAITFNAGSLVMSTTGPIDTTSSPITFGAAASDLIMVAGVAGVNIAAPVVFNSPGICTITTTQPGNGINTTAAGPLTFNAGSLTLISSASIATNASILFAAGAGSLTMITPSGFSEIVIGAGITFNSTAGSMDLIANGSVSGGSMDINGPVIFNSPNTCTLVGIGGGGITSTASGTLTFNAGSLSMLSESTLTIGALVSFPNTGAGSLTMDCTDGVIIINAGITFNSTAGSLKINSDLNLGSVIQINSPVIFNSPNTGTIIARGGASASIMTFAGGTILMGTSAGPFTIQSSLSSITFGGTVTNNSASTLTIDSGTTATFNALLTNASTFTGTSLFVNAGGNITFGVSPGGFTSSSPGASVFVANATSNGSFSTDVSSPFTTSSSGSVSITAQNVVGSAAISIPGTLTLGSSGAFSATALAGTINLNGSINSTAGGNFTVSAPNTSVPVTINGTNNTTSSFAAGSIVNISSNGSTGGVTLGPTTPGSMTFNAGAGSLTVSSTGPIMINTPLTYAFTGLCQFLGTGVNGSIANNANGAMSFDIGCGDVTFESVSSTIIFNNNNNAQINFGSGNATVKTDSGTGGSITTGHFDFESGPGKSATFNSNAALTLNGPFTYNNTSDTCNITSVGLITVGANLILNSGALNMTSTGGGITTNHPIQVDPAAGALTMNAFGTITIGATISDGSTSPLTMTTTSATGDILLNALVTTSGNATYTASRNITLLAGINYTQAAGIGTFIAGQADSAGEFLTNTTSTLGTSGSGVLSITSANAANLGAILIQGPLNLTSSGSFSATATTGLISFGGITTSGGGAFSASALGPSAQISFSAPSSFTGSAVNLMAGTGGIVTSPISAALTFAAGPGSLTINSVGQIFFHGALTYAATGNCQITCTGGDIDSNAARPFNFNAGSGPISFTANTIPNQAINLTNVTNNSASSLTITSSGTTTFNNLTNNSTLGTTSLIVSAGENIVFNPVAQFSSSSPGTSTFTANTAALGSFSTDATSLITTTSTAGTVSITAANATGLTAVNILCPITLASPNAFSATATTGNVVISGAITSSTTTNGAFNVSAPGESGAITLSGVDSFSPGSAVSLSSAGLTTLSGTTKTFGSVASATGSLTVNAGSISIINTTLTYNSPGACQFIASGLLTNSPAGIMNFNGSGPVTFQSTAGAVTFDNTALINFIAGAGSVTVQTTAPAGGAINVGPFTFNSGGAKTASFSSNSTLTLSGAFSYGGSSGTSSLTSAGLLTLNGTLNLNAAGAFNMASTGNGLTTTASGPITVAATAGPLSMSALGTITLGAALHNNSNVGSPTLSMTTTGPIGDILLNAAVTTNGSATLSAARNLTFAGGIGYTQTAGTGSFLAGQAAEGLFSITSALQTSGSGSLSITSSNAPASNAISIAALTLNSTGLFSATATQGNVSISGAIASTLTGSFAVSAPGTAGAITLNGPTLNFNTSSLVSLIAAGSTTLSSPTMTFGASSGPLTVSGNTAGVTISGAVAYNSTGAFAISSTGSTITTTSAGPITVTAGTGLTMTASGLITLGGTVQYNSSDVNGFAATSTAGGITITAPVTVSTTAPLALSATTAGQQVLIQNQVTNSSSGNITVTSSNLTLEPVAGSGTSAQLGTLSGLLALTNVTQVSLIGGTAANAFAQLGYNTGSPTSNITFTNCNSLLMQPGTVDHCYTLVGHGSPTAGALILSGTINISGTGNLTMGTSGNGTNCFSQIGHVQSNGSNTTATGSISVNLGGSVSLTGGDNTNTYALIGHGGVSSSTGTYTGDVTVVAGGNIVLETRSAGVHPAFAAIGPTAITNGIVMITGGHTITATSTSGSIILQPAANNECVIGAYVRGSGVNNLQPLTINVTTGQDLIMTGAPNPGASLSGALIGALAHLGTTVNPFTPEGTSSSTLTVTVGRNLEMQTSTGGVNNTTFTAIQNGLTGATSTTVNVAGATTLMGGNNLSTITSIGALTLNGTGDVTLLSNQTATPLGAASLIGNGNTSISGNGVTLTGFIGGPQALIQTPTGNLSVLSNSMTLASNSNILLTGGSGVLTVNALTGDLNLNSLASIQNSGTGPTSMTVGAMVSLTAGAGDVTIINGMGMLMMNITDNLNLITNTGGSASITSGGPITISAQNAALFGLGTGQSLIQTTTAGDILLMAMNDITLDDNALINNMGPGKVTLVADQQAPLPPQIGAGRFILNPGANVTSSGGLLQVFTARPNSISAGNLAFGDLNTHSATETVVCPFDKPTPSDTNVYDTYYDLFLLGDGVGASLEAFALGAQGIPYTIYYKTPFIPPVPPIPPTPPTPVVPQPVLVRNLSKISFASAQIFTFLREYPEYPKYKSDEMEFYLKCKICRKRVKRFCMDVDDRYPYIHQNWTLYPIGL